MFESKNSACSVTSALIQGDLSDLSTGWSLETTPRLLLFYLSTLFFKTKWKTKTVKVALIAITCWELNVLTLCDSKMLACHGKGGLLICPKRLCVVFCHAHSAITLVPRIWRDMPKSTGMLLWQGRRLSCTLWISDMMYSFRLWNKLSLFLFGWLLFLYAALVVKWQVKSSQSARN